MWFRKPAKRRCATGLLTSPEVAEVRVLLSASPIGGVGNNVAHPDWGSAGTDLLRKAPAAYADGVSSPGGQNRPSPRAISNAVSDQAGQDIINDRLMSAMIYSWGQFIDHDIDLTPTGTTEKLSIAVPKGDPSFDPFGTGTQTIDTMRSIFDPATGTSRNNPRQQVNTITAFLDGSMVYGSDAATASTLRSFVGGRLNTSQGNLLPRNNTGDLSGDPLNMANDAHLVANDQLFAAGDVRANENIELTSLQTLFVREHNYWADKISTANPKLSDEAVYQRARAIVVGEIQAITYNEWLPALLGNGAIAKYTGYKPDVNPGISNEFSTAAFRFGHSLLGDDIEFLGNNGQEVTDAIPLSQAFFNPEKVAQTGIDPILKYLSSDPASEVDPKVVDSVRNFLFGPPGSGGLDLASLNIERGRDHGLADYNTTRAAYGLPKVQSFSQITSDPQLQAQLKDLYGSVNNIDLWVGGLAEDHLPGSSVGPTFQRILVDQFTRLRDGDRYWYQNQMSGQQLQQVSQTSLSDIIKRNTGVTNLQQNVFFFKAAISGSIVADQNGNHRPDPQERGVAGVSVDLINKDDGQVVATTMTDRQGRYFFGVKEGLRTGIYQVRVRQIEQQSGPPIVSRPIAVTRGDQMFRDVNLAVPGKPKPPSKGQQAIASSDTPSRNTPLGKTNSSGDEKPCQGDEISRVGTTQKPVQPLSAQTKSQTDQGIAGSAGPVQPTTKSRPNLQSAAKDDPGTDPLAQVKSLTQMVAANRQR